MKPIILLCALALPLTAACQSTGNGIPHPGPNDVVFLSNGTTTTLTCKEGGSAFLNGNMNHVQVNGNCTTVHVLGNKNVVAVAQRTELIVEGNLNTVHYADPQTKVSTLGNGNSVNLNGK